MARDRLSLLRDRFEIGTSTNTLFTYVMVVAMVALFWGESPTVPLIMWGLLLASSATTTYAIRSRELEFARWFKIEVITQVASGVTWGLVAIIAMPADAVHQTLLVAILSSVLIASSAGEAQFRALYLAFMVPFAASVVTGFFIYPGGLRSAASLFVVAAAFSIVSSNDDRKLHHGFVDLLLENQELADQLAVERDTLTSANERLDRLAWSDPLTGLANRAGMNRALEDALAATIEESDRVSVAYVDLDDFKSVNDRYGHRAGDLLLIAVAKRLFNVIDSDELPCRPGGDEITVVGHCKDLDGLGDRVASVFDEPFRIDGHVLSVTASIGLATTTEPCAPDELLRRADHALYRRKRGEVSARYLIWEAADELAPVDELQQ